MFGWRRREQGFEWHQYVRTTIKLKRDARRDKAEQIKNQAADSVKAAGAAAAETVAAASAAAAERLKAAGAAAADKAKVAGTVAGAAARQSAKKLDAGSRVVAESLGRRLATVATWAGRAIGIRGRQLVQASQPAMKVLARPPIHNALLIAGAVLCAGGLFRWANLRVLDAQTVVVASAGVIALVLTGVPRLLLAGAKPLPSWLGGRRAGMAVAVLLAAGTALLVVLKVASFAPMLSNIASLKRLPFSAPEIVDGRANVVGGDIIRIGQRGIRLAGLELPDREQTCTRPGNKRWRCGEASLAVLSRLAGGRSLKCEIDGRDDSGNDLAVCRDGQTEINADLVKGGHAFAMTGLLSRYGALEAEAQSRKVGIWSGEVLRPGQWRQKVWDDALKRAPSGCPIKGQVQGKARTYVLPWSGDYERARVITSRGGRWFCTEEEAIAAGWKGAGRG